MSRNDVMSQEGASLRERIELTWKEENRAAQIAAAEAVAIGREVAQDSVRQGEQLAHADELADETKYTLDKAKRGIRNLTWTGWIANLVTKDVTPPEADPQSAKIKRYLSRSSSSQDNYIAPLLKNEYKDAPENCRTAVEAFQNYLCNLEILEECESPQQRIAATVVCAQLHAKAAAEVSSLHMEAPPDIYKRLYEELSAAHNYQRQMERDATGQPDPKKSPLSSLRSELVLESSTDTAEFLEKIEQQEKHLDSLSNNLNELQYLSQSINQTFDDQSAVLDKLDGKADTLTDETRLVIRRADQLAQKSLFKRTKPKMENLVAIRHMRTGKYMVIDRKIKDVIVGEFHPELSVFSFWSRSDCTTFGLQNTSTDTWLGQVLGGGIACSSTSYGRREEWDMDLGEETGALLCASANWGNGGWLSVRPNDGAFIVGGHGLGAEKNADKWMLVNLAKLME